VTPIMIREPLRVVAIGGGTGLPRVLRGLKAELFPDGVTVDPERLVAIVTVMDEGGSSGRLRSELGVLPPGDIRNCLVALSHNEPLMARLFQARYQSAGALDGHSLGNLILAGLAQIDEDGFLGAIRDVSEVLNIYGRVLPATLENTRLVAVLRDGREIVGETELAPAGGAVERLRLEPDSPAATDGVVEAIHDADIVVLGPGSLFTSILPNLLVPEVAEAVRASGAFRILVLNAMTEPGETLTFSAADHVRAIETHAGAGLLDAALLPSDDVPAHQRSRYLEEGGEPVGSALEELEALVPRVFVRPVLEFERHVRHDPARTAEAVLEAHDEWTRRPLGGWRSAGGATRRAGR
jgi:uncharacterized cofD-like protein